MGLTPGSAPHWRPERGRASGGQLSGRLPGGSLPPAPVGASSTSTAWCPVTQRTAWWPALDRPHRRAGIVALGFEHASHGKGKNGALDPQPAAHSSRPLACCGDLPVALGTFEPEPSGHFAPGAESSPLSSAICAVFPVCDARSTSQNNKDSGPREFRHNRAAPTSCTDYFAALR